MSDIDILLEMFSENSTKETIARKNIANLEATIAEARKVETTTVEKANAEKRALGAELAQVTTAEDIFCNAEVARAIYDAPGYDIAKRIFPGSFVREIGVWSPEVTTFLPCITVAVPHHDSGDFTPEALAATVEAITYVVNNTDDDRSVELRDNDYKSGGVPHITKEGDMWSYRLYSYGMRDAVYSSPDLASVLTWVSKSRWHGSPFPEDDRW